MDAQTPTFFELPKVRIFLTKIGAKKVSIFRYSIK